MREVKILDGAYGVTEDGRVISYQKKTADGIPIPQELRGFVSKNGSRFVLLSKNGLARTALVHQLVAKAFVPNPHHYTDVIHKDGNPLNNRADNLEWVTHSESMRRAVKQTTCSICGETGQLAKTVCKECRRSIMAMLLDDQKIETLARSLEGIDPKYWDKHQYIFERRAAGKSVDEIAQECGCSKQNISSILRRGLAKAALAAQKKAVKNP